MSDKSAPGGRRIAQNRKARRDYHLERPFEVGIRLTGTEVKSLRAGRANINDAYATERGGEVFLINAHISQYDGAGPFNHDPLRPRKLLLHKREIRKLVGALRRGGVTLVQGLITIAVGLLVYVVLAYWLTGQIQGPLVPLINIDLGPLVVLIAVLGGVWLAARQYFARDHGAFTFQGSNWTLALPFSKRVQEPDIFRLVNAVFDAREYRLEGLGLRPPPARDLCQR